MHNNSLSDRWCSWVKAHKHGESYNISKTKFKDHIVAELRLEGFAVPSRIALESTIVAGLEDLEKVQRGAHAPGKECSLIHLLNLVWQPILHWIDDLAKGQEPPWPEHLEKNKMALQQEMMGIVIGADEAVSIDEWVEFLRKTILRLVDVDVPSRLVLAVMSPLAPLHIETTRAFGLHVLRSSLCSKLLGPTLAAQVGRMLLAELAELPVPLLTEQEVNLGAKGDLVATLTALHCGHDSASDEDLARPTKRSRRPQAIKDLLKSKTEQTLFVLRNRVSMTRSLDTITGAVELVENLEGNSSENRDPSSQQVLDLLVSRFALVRHALLLDGALDRHSSDHFLDLREKNNFAGVALATDESPPKQPRFRGLRFQITVMYAGTFAPRAEWEGMSDPPILSSSILGDIMHCAGKKGVDVSRILERQLARVGLNSYDVVACTGDGGGENEGSKGVHAHFENLNSGYVRHRCLPHIAWRTADMAIKAACLDYKTLAAYLVEGITWSRLRELAVRTPAQGGLDLFRDGSRHCKEIFGKNPSAIISTRPETDMAFLKLLKGKEHVLHQLATQDLTQRNLEVATQTAVMNLGDITQRIKRVVLCELIGRCMFLLYWSGKNSKVASVSSWEDIMAEATTTIWDLKVTPEVLERFSTANVAPWAMAMAAEPDTWVELAVQQVVGEQHLVAEYLPEALKFHRIVAGQASGHLALLADNTFRTPWLAAKLLSKDAAVAQTAAAALAKQLATTRPSNRTHFETHVIETPELWQNLMEFAEGPRVLLWHGHARYETLFRLLAPRFLLAPDHVLDAERVHARWQWLCSVKRGLKVHMLNASLRLMHYLENNQGFPHHEDLQEHLEAERVQHNLSLAAIEDADEIAPGYRCGRVRTSKTRIATSS